DRADILMDRPFFIHHKNIFSFQYFFYRKVTLYLNRHFLSPPFSCCHTGLFPGLRKPCILIRFLLDPCPRVSEILPRKEPGSPVPPLFYSLRNRTFYHC